MGRKAISVDRRIREFPGCGFVNSEGTLFCTWCCRSVDFTRKSIIINHLESAGHRKVQAKTNDLKPVIMSTNEQVLPSSPSPSSSSITTSSKKISVERRLREFPDCGFIKSDGTLFCTWCRTDVDFFKRSTIVSHLKSAGHAKRKAVTNNVVEQKPPQVHLSLNTKREAISVKRSIIINRLKSATRGKRKAYKPVTKVQKLRVRSSLLSRRKAISVERRLREFPDCGFINTEGTLFCTWCCTDVDFFKRSTIVSHLKSAGHAKRNAVVFSEYDEEHFWSDIFFLKSCIFCKRDCSRCPKSIWDDDEKKKVLKLVFTTKSTGGFRSFFWKLLLGSSANKIIESSFGIAALDKATTVKEESAETNNSSRQDAANDVLQVLPVCTACLGTAVAIRKLHCDLEKIQMQMIDHIGILQRSVKVSTLHSVDEPNQDKRQLEVLSQFRRKISTQSEKSIKFPLVYLERFHTTTRSNKPLPDCNVNNILIKQEPMDVVQNPQMSPTSYDDRDNWSPSGLCASDIDDNEDNDEDYMINPTVKKRRSRPTNKSFGKRLVGRPHKDGSLRKRSSSSKVSRNPQPESSDISGEPKKSYRLLVRKNIWKPDTARVPDSKKMSFHTFYRCDICGKTYCKRTAFLKHKRAHKEEATSNKKMASSENTFSEQINKNCSVCKQDISKSDYYEHLLSHEKEVGNKMDSEAPFACSHKDCIRTFYIEENLKIHMDFDHDEISSSACLLKVKKCDLCQMCYDTSSDLLEHFKKAHKEQSHCLYYCPVCAYSYSQSENLISHMHSHRNKDQQICFVCKMTSANRNELLIHFEQSHGVATKRECEICKEKFADIYWYNFHLKDVHKRKETFICSFCGKICHFPGSFMRHMEMHKQIEKRGIRCEICNDAFANEDKLSLHRVKFHNAPKLPCKDCGREYSTPSLLSAHMKFHNKPSFRCPVCDKSFGAFSTLYQHKIVHMSERAYTCEFCGFACKTKYCLKRHQSTHEKKYECNVCGRKFSRPHALNVHSKMHTDETLVCPYCGCEFHSRKSWRRHVKAYHESDNPLPMNRPHKKRRACLRWKDTEGNVHFAKNAKQNEWKFRTQAPINDQYGTVTTTQDQMNYDEENTNDNKPGTSAMIMMGNYN